jgi:hypothetical protein
MRYENREKWIVTNKTKKTIAIGDLVQVPEFGPNQTHDILKHVTREKAEGSKVLNYLIKTKQFSIKKKDVISGKRTEDITETNYDGELVTPSERNVKKEIEKQIGESNLTDTPSSSEFTRDVSGNITLVEYANGRTVTINRNLDGEITTIVDSTKGTFTINRNVDKVITGVTVT